MSGFALKANADWAKHYLAPGSAISSDGLARLSAVAQAGRSHEAIVAGGGKPRYLPEFRWANTVLGNFKTSFKGRYHLFAVRRYATRYLSSFAYRFNRRFDLQTLHARLLLATAARPPHPERTIRATEDCC